MLQCPLQVGPYRLRGLLGRGGMGDVFQGFHELLRRPVALKRIHRSKYQGEVARRRLLFEARTVARLNHPAIVQVYDFLEHEEDLWIVMELVNGQTLRRRLRRSMTWRQVVDVARPVVDGLGASHGIGILHRDLKAENVFLVKGGGAKLFDFGLAKDFQHPVESGEPISTVGQILGTPRSMSPEQARGEELDPRSDLFSLGIMLYECLCGSSPFQGPTLLSTLQNVCRRDPAPVRAWAPDVPEALDRLIADLLRKDPRERPGSADEVAERLVEIVPLARSESSSRPGGISTWSHARATTEDESPARESSATERKPRRRHITLLSCEIRGWELAAALQELPTLRRKLSRLCERYGGVLVRASNHRLVAAFGSLVAHEDDALRAVEIGLGWLRETRLPGEGIQLCAVVHAGKVNVHRYRPPSRGIELDALLDEAKALAERAGHGQIVVSETVRSLMATVTAVSTAGRVEDLGALSTRIGA